MAKITSITLVDDIDGGPADEIVEFALDGRSYEIDLSAEHATELRTALAPYIGAGRRAGTGAVRRRGGAGTGPGRRDSAVQSDREANAAIREWAVKRGIKVADRGRIPRSVLAAYAEALSA